MKRTVVEFAAIVLFSVAPIFGSGGPQVDASDLPQIQNESFSEPAIGQHAGQGSQAKWDSLEQGFLSNLTTSERETYHQLKEQFILLRARLSVVRDSIAALTPEQRQMAIKAIGDRIFAELKNVETQVISRLNAEQRNARTQRKSELERKRAEIQQHMQQLRQELQERLK